MTGAGASYRFEGKTLLISGGAGDIGRAVARRALASGASVALLDLADKAEGALAGLGGERAAAFACDVTDLERAREAFGAAAARFGRIDYLFNNAGYQGVFAPTDRYPADDFKKVLDVNVLGVYHLLVVAAQHMKGSGGAIVNSASHAGVRGPPNMLAYAASKFAVVGMTQTAAKDLAPYKIRVNAVSPALIGPGFMWTRQTELQARAGSPYFPSEPEEAGAQMIASVPLKRLGTLGEVAGAVLFLLSDEASYLTGFNLEVTGGL